MQHTQEQTVIGKSWSDEEGMHVLSRGIPPSPEEQKRMTEEYQKQIKKSPMWKMMVAQYGEERAKEMLKEFQVHVKS